MTWCSACTSVTPRSIQAAKRWSWVCARPPRLVSRLRWSEARTSPKASAMRKPGGLERSALIVIEQATHGATVIQHDLASIRRRVGRGGDVLGYLVRQWWSSRGRRGRGNSGGLAGDAPLLQHLAFNGTQPAYFAAHLDLGVTIRLQHGLGQVAQKMIDAIPMRDPGKLGRNPGDERGLFVRQPQADRQP